MTGPRALKVEGSPEWCLQTVDLLKRYLFNIEQTWRQADQVVDELARVGAWKVLPSPDKPYGTFNKLCLDLLGMPASNIRGLIHREKIKALGEYGTNQHSGGLDGINSSKGGTDPVYVIARLKRDDPALAEKVVRGEVSAYSAARSKGWKPPRIQVTTPQRVAAHLRRHMSSEDLTLLAKLITEE